MKKNITGITTAILSAALLTSCITVGPSLKYAAREKPKGKIQTKSDYSQTMKISRTGFAYRPPAELDQYFSRAETAAESPVLKDFDIVLNTPGCIIFFCFGKDKVRINKPGEPTFDELNNL